MFRLLCFHVQNSVRSADFRGFSRLPWLHVQTFVRSRPDFCAFIKILSVQQTIARLCQDFLSSPEICAYVRLFVRSCPDVSVFMSRLSCVHQTFTPSCPDFWAHQIFSCICTYFRTFMFRFSWVQVQIFKRSAVLRAFMLTHFSSSPEICAFVRILARSCPDVCLFMSKLSCVHSTFVRSSSDFHALMSTFSCLQNYFVHKLDFCPLTFRVYFLLVYFFKKLKVHRVKQIF